MDSHSKKTNDQTKQLGVDYPDNWQHPIWGYNKEQLEAAMAGVVAMVQQQGLIPTGFNVELGDKKYSSPSELLHNNIQHEWPW